LTGSLVLGEPMLVGAVIGLAIGFGAQMALKDVLNLAMNLGASMILMPRMISLLMEGLVPIFQAAREWILQRFPGYDFRVGLDAAVLVGKTEVLVNGMIMVPVMIGLMFILPGNKVLPFADLSVLAFFTMWGVGVNKGISSAASSSVSSSALPFCMGLDLSHRTSPRWVRQQASRCQPI
jgi:PTS system galactitol-specific IIC component